MDLAEVVVRARGGELDAPRRAGGDRRGRACTVRLHRRRVTRAVVVGPRHDIADLRGDGRRVEGEALDGRGDGAGLSRGFARGDAARASALGRRGALGRGRRLAGSCDAGGSRCRCAGRGAAARAGCDDEQDRGRCREQGCPGHSDLLVCPYPRSASRYLPTVRP